MYANLQATPANPFFISSNFKLITFQYKQKHQNKSYAFVQRNWSSKLCWIFYVIQKPNAICQNLKDELDELIGQQVVSQTRAHTQLDHLDYGGKPS